MNRRWQDELAEATIIVVAVLAMGWLATQAMRVLVALIGRGV